MWRPDEFSEGTPHIHTGKDAKTIWTAYRGLRNEIGDIEVKKSPVEVPEKTNRTIYTYYNEEGTMTRTERFLIVCNKIDKSLRLTERMLARKKS